MQTTPKASNILDELHNPKEVQMEALGVDVGGVIIDKTLNDNTDTSFFSDNYLKTTAVLDVFNVLKQLVSKRFDDQVFIVSKCGESVEEKTRHWLRHHNFYERTGILPRNVRFCRTRPGKAPICSGLGITHFVDDKLEVLGYLTTVPNQFLLQGEPEEILRFGTHVKQVHQVDSWQQIAEKLL